MTTLAQGARGGRLRPASAALSAEHVAGAAVLLASAVAAAGVSADAGGYYPTAWGWASLAALAAAAVALGAGGLPLGRRDWAALAALTGWLAIVAAGAMRVGAATAGVPELERGGMYVVVLWTALVALRGRTIEWCLAGLLLGIAGVAGTGLAGVLFPNGAAPDYYEGRLLYRPVGYANGMGILIVFGIVIALAFASHGRTLARRLAAALLVPLTAALALTGSRGAMAALVAALVLSMTLDRAAPQLALLVLPALAAAVAASSHLSDAAASARVVARDGRFVAVAIASLAFANAALAARSPACRRRRRRLPAAVAAAIGILGCAALPFAAHDRLPYWRAAWADYAAHPLLGSGPGTFAAAWLRYRDTADSTLDAHSLYLQTLAEIGPIGLAALLLALAVPLTGIRRARSRYAPAAAAAYAAFLLHAAVDWDWQLPAVTLVALVLGAVLVAGSRPDAEQSRFPVPIAGSATALAALAVCALLVGNRALVGASHAARAHDWPQARALAARAAWWQPWSAEPLLVLGQAQAAIGARQAARASFSRAAQLAPNDWRPWYDLALATQAPEGPRRFSSRHGSRAAPAKPHKTTRRSAFVVPR